MNTSPETLSPAQLHALKIVAKGAEPLRDRLKAGTQSLDFGVHITGDLIISPNGSMMQPRKADPILVIAALLSYFGTRKRSSIVEEIIESGLVKAVKDPEQTKELASTLLASLETRELVDRRGNVTGKFNVVPVHVGKK